MSIKYCIVGNPNSGKSSLFNNLTGLNQQVGNYPGVTVDRKVGKTQIGNSMIEVVDLPGTYTVYPKSEDELVTMQVLTDPKNADYPSKLIVVIDATHLSRNMLFFTQVRDLGFKCVIALTMTDIARKNGITINIDKLQRKFGVPIVPVNPRLNKGTKELKSMLSRLQPESNLSFPENDYYRLGKALNANERFATPYAALVYASDGGERFDFLSEEEQTKFDEKIRTSAFRKQKFQAEDTYRRFAIVKNKLEGSVYQTTREQKKMHADKIDRILLHRIWGNAFLFLTLFIVFQTIYKVAVWPMALVEGLFQTSASFMRDALPTGWVTDLWIEGIWAGLSGIAIFIPQIMLLFALINILEDSGYMARISFLSDRMLRKVGLSGRSTMPLISSFACAVPSIMATRTIPNRKERLLSILSIPLLSCTARLPVYVILIGLIIPDRNILGIVSLQALMLLGIYLFGIFFSMLTAYVMNKFIKSKSKSHFFLELPHYRTPRWRNVLLSAYEKTKIFVIDAGKIILLISVFLWFLASYGPKEKMLAVTQKYETAAAKDIQPMSKSTQAAMAAEYLENSYAGQLGHFLEPVIRPLGFDWKIGIALITSFAAREVFVSTMSTIYSIGDDASDVRLMEKMEQATDRNGQKVFTLGTSLALIVFYILAMQCMSTLAIIRRETNSWKWPLVITIYMSALAYLLAYFTQVIF